MNKELIAVGIILLFIGAAVIPSTGQKAAKCSLSRSRGHTLYVGGSGPGNYSKIQDAINASSDGDTVFVFHGSYHEKVLINKSISVLGENTSRTFINYTLEPNWYQHVVLICSHDVVFSGFTVFLEHGDSVGIRLNDSSNCTISHNILKSSWGMYLHNSYHTNIENNSFFSVIGGVAIADKNTNSSYNIIKHNWFTNSGDAGHAWNFGVMFFDQARYNIVSDNYFYHCSDSAILSYSPYRNIIERNVIWQNISRDTGITIYIYYSESIPPGNIIRENDIAGCSLGIATKGDYFTINDNFLHDNDWGMELFTISFYHVTVSNNTFLNNSIGLDLENGKYGSVVERNVFHDCGAALDLLYCQGLTVRHNNLTDNSRAIYSAESKSNIISQNNFIGNHRNVLSLFSRDIWRGNYWDEPRSLPKLILGILPFIQFDWHPAQKPN